MKVRCALPGSVAAAPYWARYLAWLFQAHAMTDFSGSRLKKLASGSRLPFQSSCLVTARRRVRPMTCRITVSLGGSTQMTVSARDQTIG
jgi:hypothetical protein